MFYTFQNSQDMGRLTIVCLSLQFLPEYKKRTNPLPAEVGTSFLPTLDRTDSILLTYWSENSQPCNLQARTARQGFAATRSSFDCPLERPCVLAGASYFLANYIMSKTKNRHSALSNFEGDFIVPWEQAFNKFGFQDGAFSMTSFVASEIEDEGYTVNIEPWGMHNDVITSIIKEDGKELMLISNNSEAIGYADPRTYLPQDLISSLDQQFYC